ncbi:HIRAN domain-containing protein [Helicobacter himalayensis]|uniref:HIRAN domain-containing protein n=1 Tax=Helicobacter himalayensis TaxID=1591088 RepID=UPI003D6DE348
MNPTHILIIGLQTFGSRPHLRLGRILRLEKEPQNPFDEFAIRAELPYIGIVGYVARRDSLKISLRSQIEGCKDARGIYFDFITRTYARVEFLSEHWAICALCEPKTHFKIP